ncbi:unnamed protein product, partial [Symbiodinium necroappetens]
MAWQGLGHVVIFITKPSADTGYSEMVAPTNGVVVPFESEIDQRVREMGCAKFGEILKKPRVPSAGEIEKNAKHVEHRHRLSQKLFRLSDHSPFLLCCVCSLLYGRWEVAKLKYVGQTPAERSQRSKWNADCGCDL